MPIPASGPDRRHLLLVHLLHAIGAGTLAAGVLACGGKAASVGTGSTGLDGAGQGSGNTTTGTTTGSTSATGSAAGGSSARGGAGTGGETGATTTGDSGGADGESMENGGGPGGSPNTTPSSGGASRGGAGGGSTANGGRNGGGVGATTNGGTGGDASHAGLGGTDYGGSQPAGGSTQTTGGSSSVSCEFGTAATFCLTVGMMEQQARTGVGEISLDPPRTDEEIAAGYDTNGCMRHDWMATGCCNPAEAPGVPQDNGDCCYVACEGGCCGRPLIVDGVPRTAASVRRDDWLPAKVAHHPEVNGELTMEAARELGKLWLSDALMEHASIASFARFSLDLLTMGAPAALVRCAQQAALDEVDHAERCFALASRLLENATGPSPLSVGAFSERTLAEAVAAAIAEGCVGETLAAGLAREQALVTGDEAVRDTLSKLADDELAHAELAWRFVAWALVKAPELRSLAARTFEHQLTHLPTAPNTRLPTALLNHWGRLDRRQWHTVTERLRTEVLAPAVAHLLNASASTGLATCDSERAHV